MRDFQGKEGNAAGNACDMVVPGPSRCLLSGVVYCLVIGIEHCVTLYEKGECLVSSSMVMIF